MLIIKNLSYKNLFENISFEIEKGVIGIFGPSGSGKTTFLKIAGGFIQPDNGKILFQKGEEVFKIQQGKLPNSQFSIGFHFQDYNLLELDVKTNIELPFIVGGYTKDNEWLDYLLEYFEIKNLLNKDISQISGGEKERVSIVRTFANKPNIVLLDEAGAALDERLKNKLYDFIKKYSKENTILAISHDPNLKNLLNLNNQIYNGNFKILKQS